MGSNVTTGMNAIINATSSSLAALDSNTSSVVIDANPALKEFDGQETYSTTFCLLLFVHLLFVYNWWQRQSRKRLLVSYKILIQKKHYHKALLALLSHAPTRASNQEQYLSQFVPTPIRDWYNASNLFNGRSLSGLPLLFYNSHLLWNCRAVETLFYQEYNNVTMTTTTAAITLPYARGLWGLTLVGLALDLGFTSYILRMVRDMNHATSSTTNHTRPEVVEQVEMVLCQRPLGGLACTTCAVLAIFRHQFPYVPIQVLPFLPTWFPLVSIPSISYAFVVSALLVMNVSIHPISSVIFGSLSGMLWSLNITSFLDEPYWSNGAILAYAMATLFSLRATGSPWAPCVDVSWDDQGRRILSTNEALFEQQAPNVATAEASGDDNDDASTHSLAQDQELPLYSSYDGNNSQQELRHRLPIMTDMDDNDDEDELSTFLPTNTVGGNSTSNNNSRSTPTMRRTRRTRL